MEKENKKENNRSWMVLAAFILFIYQAIYFLNLEGSQLAIPSTLYNMILYLFICLFILFKKDLYESII